MSPARKIERAEVETAVRDLLGEGEQAARQYAGMSISLAGAISLLGLAFAFLMGRRRGRRRNAVIEIRRG
jgi:hypothetical protein